MTTGQEIASCTDFYSSLGWLHAAGKLAEAIDQAIAEAVAAEREACANLCLDSLRPNCRSFCHIDMADEIRLRSRLPSQTAETKP
jgi:hypothetical protein